MVQSSSPSTERKSQDFRFKCAARAHAKFSNIPLQSCISVRSLLFIYSLLSGSQRSWTPAGSSTLPGFRNIRRALYCWTKQICLFEDGKTRVGRTVHKHVHVSLLMFAPLLQFNECNCICARFSNWSPVIWFQVMWLFFHLLSSYIIFTSASGTLNASENFLVLHRTPKYHLASHLATLKLGSKGLLPCIPSEKLPANMQICLLLF